MTETPPVAGIDPAKTVLIRIAGTLILAVAGLIAAFGVILTIAFGGSDPLPARLLSLLREPVVWGFLLFAASGVGLIVHARHRDKSSGNDWKDRRRKA